MKRQDPSLDLQVIELSGGINANALLVAGDVDANFTSSTSLTCGIRRRRSAPSWWWPATVHVEPLGIYSKKFKTPEGGTGKRR